MTRHRSSRARSRVGCVRVLPLLIAAWGTIGLAGCNVGAVRTSGHPPAQWVRFRHVPGVVDIAGPRRDGSFAVAAAGKLLLLESDDTLRPFARGATGYSTPQGPEPYLALAGPTAGQGPGCSFHLDTVFAIEPTAPPGVIAVDAEGHARRFVDLPRASRLNGITFDSVGRFGHRLLVTSAGQGRTTVFAVNCDARVTTITTNAPTLEGGITVAPSSFGGFGGDLIAPDEGSGRIVAVAPNGRSRVLVRSGLPKGGDIGVESAGFVPTSFGRTGLALVADRFSSGNRHPGTNSLLSLSGTQLMHDGAQPGDLLVASEGGAKTIIVHCTTACSVRHIADGPGVAHAEGHIVFLSSGP